MNENNAKDNKIKTQEKNKKNPIIKDLYTKKFKPKIIKPKKEREVFYIQLMEKNILILFKV